VADTNNFILLQFLPNIFALSSQYWQYKVTSETQLTQWKNAWKEKCELLSDFCGQGYQKIEICGGMIVQYSDICGRRTTRREWERDSKVRLGNFHPRRGHEGPEGE